MSRRILLRPEAQTELIEARDWYESHRPGLGSRFWAAAEDAISAIAERPLAYPRVHGETRRKILERFPYAVFYRVVQEEVVILGVVHGRRHPRSWKSRS